MNLLMLNLKGRNETASFLSMIKDGAIKKALQIKMSMKSIHNKNLFLTSKKYLLNMAERLKQ